MNKRLPFMLCTLLAVWAGSASSSYAQTDSLLPQFPERCAQTAYDGLHYNLQSSSSSVAIVSDEGPWESKTRLVVSLYSDLMAPTTEILAIAENNQSKPRVSNSQSRQASKILRKYERHVMYLTPVLGNVGSFTNSSKFDQYKCLTDTCPSGVTCTPLYIHKEGEEFAKKLPLFRRFHNEAIEWASNVRHLKRKVAQLKRAFTKVEKEITAALADLPDHIYVIDAQVPRK